MTGLGVNVGRRTIRRVTAMAARFLRGKTDQPQVAPIHPLSSGDRGVCLPTVDSSTKAPAALKASPANRANLRKASMGKAAPKANRSRAKAHKASMAKAARKGSRVARGMVGMAKVVHKGSRARASMAGPKAPKAGKVNKVNKVNKTGRLSRHNLNQGNRRAFPSPTSKA